MIFVDEALSSLISPALIYKHYCESNEQNNRDYNQLIVLMEHDLLLSSFDQHLGFLKPVMGPSRFRVRLVIRLTHIFY